MLTSFERSSQSQREHKDLLRNYFAKPYLFLARRIWWRLPARLRSLPPVRLYGMHLHALVRRTAERKQNHSTFFFRNRPELELVDRLIDRKGHGSSLKIAVIACSKGAEVYSFVWTIRSARPDLNLSVSAVDISQEILEFASEGVYSFGNSDIFNAMENEGVTGQPPLLRNTYRDQKLSIFERMNEHEMETVFDREGDKVKIKSWLKEGITWRLGDAFDPELVNVLGPQDIVVANRFLCHMKPAVAERCLRNVARLVKPGGHLFVSGVDLDVRTKVAREMGWKPVTDLIREIHEGDVSLMNDWPMEYWAQEPFQANRKDCMIRYASVFQLGEPS